MYNLISKYFLAVKYTNLIVDVYCQCKLFLKTIVNIFHLIASKINVFRKDIGEKIIKLLNYNVCTMTDYTSTLDFGLNIKTFLRRCAYRIL